MNNKPSAIMIIVIGTLIIVVLVLAGANSPRIKYRVCLAHVNEQAGEPMTLIRISATAAEAAAH